MMGLRAKAQRALDAGPIETILKKPYRLKRVGEVILSPVRNEAYEIAKSGGQYHGWYREQLENGPIQLRKGIRSFQKQIQLHESWIADPRTKVEDWEARDPRYQAGLLLKWQQDIDRHLMQIAILRGVLRDQWGAEE